jgi:hypothetical protein
LDGMGMLMVVGNGFELKGIDKIGESLDIMVE